MKRGSGLGVFFLQKNSPGVKTGTICFRLSL